jgi:hypothetical protein
MSKTKELKSIKLKLATVLETVDTIINQDLKKLKKEYQQKVLEEKTQLLIKIAEGEKLDLNLLKSKYLKSKELHNIDETSLLVDTEELLDRIIINGNTYYYENKEKGKVYDMNNKEVGHYKNNNIILN